ncbi:hypothetical protein PHYPSEUDO_005323 [Phytophthora pseudosyringae]|uniref:Uncharacterized protein n=1 Tax=Phytophthora pseudosyringae TaxID=221518 RepID=A0A8T1VLB5_9STRA|nr:hypothetical protein PHYPSEUDO_005323 [Phytophthora pseudosyringae]
MVLCALPQAVQLDARPGRIASEGGVSKVQPHIQRLVLEREALREEKVALHQEITQYLKFQQQLQSSSGALAAPIRRSRPSDGDKQVYDVTVRCVKSEWKPVKEEAGRWVNFQSGEAPFLFHPFTRAAFDSILCRQEDVDEVQRAMCHADGTNEWPILPASRNLGLAESIAIQTLQEFDDESHVIVRSFPGQVNIRYLGLVRCGKWEIVGSKRALKYSFVIADSPANARSRNAEPDQMNVRWIDQGGAFLTLTEVSETAVQVEFNHWALLQERGPRPKPLPHIRPDYHSLGAACRSFEAFYVGVDSM